MGRRWRSLTICRLLVKTGSPLCRLTTLPPCLIRIKQARYGGKCRALVLLGLDLELSSLMLPVAPLPVLYLVLNKGPKGEHPIDPIVR